MRDKSNNHAPPENQRPFQYKPPLAPLDYVHVDPFYLILNKPYGLLSVPGKPEHHKDSLVSRVQDDGYPDASEVHRLDHSTSGLMLIARGRDVKAVLTEQFRERTVSKTYIARVWGCVENDEGVVDVPLRKNWKDSPRQIVCYERGKQAVTRWKVIARGEASTLLKLYPETGRTHQLRMHMLHIGHPILGDELYAPDMAFGAAPRLLLHALKLGFQHPVTGEAVSFQSEPDF